ncbi:MAG: DUF4326 domain-containing protein [bacterium]|nr:DUF4326 domain-containing protein [bacterium]
MPKRIQRKRTKDWRKPENTVYVGRGSRWGNPHDWREVGGSRTAYLGKIIARDYYKAGLEGGKLGYTKADVRTELRDKNLMCWCALDEPCHGDVLLEIANGGE